MRRVLVATHNVVAMTIERDVFQGLIKSRRSIRRYEPRPVEPETIDALLEAGTWAPSAHNRQPWRFAVLTAVESRETPARRMGARLRQARVLPIEGANMPAVMLECGMLSHPDDRGRLTAPQGIADLADVLSRALERYAGGGFWP